MAGESSRMQRELEGFKLAARRISEKINGAGDIWRDDKYAALQSQIGELAKNSKAVIENGERACSGIDKFFSIAAEEV